MPPAATARRPTAWGRRLFRSLAFAAAGALALIPGPANAQDPAAERLYREAERLEAAGDPDAALEELQLLVQQFPADPLAPRALLDIAELRRARGDVSATREALEKLLAEYPRTLESATAFLLQAELELEGARGEEDMIEARKTFRRVPLLYGRELYPELVARVRARIRSAGVSLLLDDPHEAAAELLPAIEDEAPSLWTGRARLLLGKALLVAGDWTAAVEIFARLAAESDPEPGSEGVATSTAADRAEARRLASFIHRHYVRPAAGQGRWLAAGRFPAEGLTLREPSGVAAAEDGRVIVTDRKAKLVALAGPDGRVLDTRAIEEAVRPGWSEEWPYVVTDTRIVVPFDGPQVNFLEPRPGKEVPLKGLQAAVRGPFGHWFIASKGWKSLLSYETRRKGQETLTQSRPEIEDLARDELGRIYALDRRSKSVLQLGLDRRPRGAFLQGSGWRRPVALELDRLSNLYVLDRGTQQIYVYDRDGSRLATLGPQLPGGIELRDPEDLAVDGSGRLYVVDARLPFVVVLE